MGKAEFYHRRDAQQYRTNHAFTNLRRGRRSFAAAASGNRYAGRGPAARCAQPDVHPGPLLRPAGDAGRAPAGAPQVCGRFAPGGNAQRGFDRAADGATARPASRAAAARRVHGSESNSRPLPEGGCHVDPARVPISLRRLGGPGAGDSATGPARAGCCPACADFECAASPMQAARPVFCPNHPQESFHRLPEDMPALRLLVVDDDAPLRKACCEIAAGMGFVPLAAGSVPEALEQMRRQPVEMLLLDLKLPGGGGLRLLSEVKDLYSRDRRGGDDRVCHRVFGGGGDAHRGGRLPDQAVRAGGVDGGAGASRPASCTSTWRAAGCANGCAPSEAWAT